MNKDPNSSKLGSCPQQKDNSLLIESRKKYFIPPIFSEWHWFHGIHHVIKIGQAGFGFSVIETIDNGNTIYDTILIHGIQDGGKSYKFPWTATPIIFSDINVFNKILKKLYKKYSKYNKPLIPHATTKELKLWLEKN